VYHGNFPRYAPTLFGASKLDGENTCILIIFELSPSVVAESRRPLEEQSPGLRLLKKWLRSGPDSSHFKRVKFISRCNNADELLSSSAMIYLAPLLNLNGKPVMERSAARRMHRNVPDDPAAPEQSGSGDILEIRSTNHDGKAIARKAFAVFKDQMSRFDLTLGFLIEGEGDAEQPERMLGGVNIHRLDTSRFQRVPLEPRSAEECARRRREKTSPALPRIIDGDFGCDGGCMTCRA
jgi:hypothetical protein